MEKTLKRKKSETLLRPRVHFINSPRDFFLLSLSFGVGLIFFSVFVYLMIKIMSLDFMSNSNTKDSFEGEGESLDTLDDLLDEEETDQTPEKIEENETPEKINDENDDIKTI
jgi:hypothetical protein